MRQAVTVGTTETEVLPATTRRDGITKNIKNAIVKNLSATTVYLQWTQEPDSLTTANGFPLGQNETLNISRNDDVSAAIIGITASGTAELRASGD